MRNGENGEEPEVGTAMRSRRTRRWLVLASLSCAFLAGEVAVRVARGELFSRVSTQRSFEGSGTLNPRFEPDDELGWRHRTGVTTETGVEGPVQVDEGGFRLNHNGLDGAAPEILAVGDSTTFGDEVGDSQTWPAKLEKLRHRRVLNAGVSGYGLDQAVLWAERLLQRHDVTWAILTFIPDDVARSTYSRRHGVPKAVFVPTGEGFELRARHLERRGAGLRQFFGHSRLLTALMTSLGARSWGDARDDNVRAHERGPELAIYLMDRFVRSAEAAGVRPLIVYLHYPKGEAPEILQHPSTLDPLIAHIRDAGYPFLDLGSAHAEAVARKRRRPFYERGWHFAPAGNKWFAGQIDAWLSGQPADQR